MGIINIEGLGEIEIQGDTPTAEEEKAILEALGATTDTIETEEVDTSKVTPDMGDVEKDLETETIIPEMIDTSLAETEKAKGLEVIGGRPTFEAAGAIFGSVLGTPLGLPGIVTTGVGGASAGGQLYDILQSYITDEPTDFATQTKRLKGDFQREAILQSFFAKVPGMFTATKRFIFGKPDDSLYKSAKRLNYPLSLSDSGNIISKGYGTVIGVFPFIGNPIKKTAAKKATFLNNKAVDTLNTFGPNVTLTKLGVDMTKASKSTLDDFRVVSSFFYDDFYKAVDKLGKVPIISTQNFKNSLRAFTKLVDDGVITLKTGEKVFGPRNRDTLYKFAKKGKNYPDYIDATQYKSLIDGVKYYIKLAQANNPGNVKVLTGIKSSLEKDLRLLTKKSYRDNLLKNVYPMSKSKRAKIDDKILSDIAEKLKFADKVYANGLENSIITKALKDAAKKEGVKLKPIPGKQVFESPPSSEFKKVDKNIFGAGFVKPGSITAEELAEALLKRKASPEVFNNLKSLIGEKQFKKFVRSKLQKAYDDSLFQAGDDVVGLTFDPYKFERNLGLTTEAGRDMMEIMLKGSNLTLQNLDDFFAVAKNHAGLKVPDVSSFVARRVTLGGTRSLVGGAIGVVGVTTDPIVGSALIYMARRTSKFLSDPKKLDEVTKLFDINTPANQMKIASLKLMDAMISESKTKQEENEFKLMKENIELMSLDQIKEGVEGTLQSLEDFNIMDNVPKQETQETENITGNTSQLPSSNLVTPNVNPNLFAQGQTTNQGLTQTEQALLSPEEQQIRLRSRGLA